MSELDPRLREALEELESYLADRLAPLLVADAMEQLLEYPPELTAEQLRLWSLFQFQAGGGSTDLADLLFHALKKVQQLEELQLVPADRFAGFLGNVARAMAERCPPDARERFVALIAHLRETVGRGGVLVDRLQRAAVGGQPVRATAPAAAQLSPEEVRELRRYKLLLERTVAGAAADNAGQQLLVMAASGAKNARELEARLAQLHSAGVGPAMGRDLVRSLIGAVPDWALAAKVGAPMSGSLEAVRKAVRLAGDGARAGERWKDLLRVASEEFNRGSFGRAITLVDLADRMVRDGEIDRRFADIAKAQAHEAYDITVLLQALVEEIHRPVVRRLLEFFPGWAPRELLDELAGQAEQKKRRLQLALLELWGAEARPLVLDRLVTTLGESGRDPNAWWYQRNLVLLLHRLPRGEGADPRQEIEIVTPFSALTEHPSFQKETFSLLAVSGEAGAALLVRRLAEAERALEGSTPPPHPAPEVWKILGAITSALARSGSPLGLRALVEHGLARRPRSGETLARLRDLATIDLSGEREVVARLLAALHELAPKRVLGFTVGRNTEELAHVARALSGTTSREVRTALAALQGQIPELEVGRPAGPSPQAGAPAREAAPRAPETPAASFVPEAARASLSGDLEVFGLPGLLQNLQQSESSGVLVLRDGVGTEVATLRLDRGHLLECRAGALVGPEAFYQIFEVPSSGSFAFARTESATERVQGWEIMALLMEAMRRYDELQRLSAVVPDDAFLKAGATKPTTPAEESDGDLLRKVWTFVRGGALARDCELHVTVDRFRVRSLLAHWLEEGALDIEGLPI